MTLKTIIIGLAAIASLGSAAQAAQLVTNGGFEIVTDGLGQPDFNTTLTGWDNGAGAGGSYYNFVFGGSTSDSAGASGTYGGLTLWGPANGSANGLGPSPDGGNFFAADGAFQKGPLSQTLTGLTPGKDYIVKFYWAGAQQFGFDGANTEQWQVGFGEQTKLTSVYQNPNHGFSGWFTENFRFTATGTSAALTFLANGTPDGVPPFSLLDGVSVTAAVPESATWVMMIAGFGLVGATARRRRQSSVAA